MESILREFPSEFETERLIIRMPKPGDGKAVYKAIQGSLSELKPWMPWADENQTEEETEINIREAHLKFLAREDLRLLGFLKETGTLVVSSGLHRINWSVPKFEIGYWVDSRFSGKGYVTEAVRGIEQFAAAELGAKRIEIRCDSNNIKSRAVAERTGFPLEAILRNDARSVEGELRDTCVFAKVF